MNRREIIQYCVASVSALFGVRCKAETVERDKIPAMIAIYADEEVLDSVGVSEWEKQMEDKFKSANGKEVVFMLVPRGLPRSTISVSVVSAAARPVPKSRKTESSINTRQYLLHMGCPFLVFLRVFRRLFRHQLSSTTISKLEFRHRVY